MNTYTHVPNLSHLVPDIPPDSIISRTLLADERIRAVLFRFAAGQELSEHTASYPAILHILEGEADLSLGEDTMAASAGTWVHMSPSLRHGIIAKTPLTMLLLLIKSGKPESRDK